MWSTPQARTLKKMAARIELEDMGFLEGKIGKLKINHRDNISSII